MSIWIGFSMLMNINDQRDGEREREIDRGRESKSQSTGGWGIIERGTVS
jgi:hypothetical protein